MSDLRTLYDAFAELERRVDAAATDVAPIVRPRRTARLVPVAATVVAVAGLFAGAVWLVPGGSGTPAGPPATAPSTTTARSQLPTTPDELIARFKAVLGDTATFEATSKTAVPKSSPSKGQQPGTYPSKNQQAGTVVLTAEPGNPDNTVLISGTLTSAGVTGGFGLTVHSSDSEPGEWCRLSRTKDCDVSTLPDGSRLVTGTGRHAPGAVSYMACLVRPDGKVILLSVSNQEDPGGAAIGTPGGRIYASQPPLTLEQMKAIVTSGKW
ncbi:hypothetical protein [Lentzea flava]|uniref:Uncharacterized protein n=1 Tax=Lentzea flava TaxID=103732 RepID=A0ABQ2UEV3_9PSEU|nr:hypothetical protein [Lentzea flava]MCP2198601.1 hypothetical protein [Lentzea flava]GGU26984.1 hypothetical protein GCM10010178_19330 [Lentzea flava]